MITHEDTVDGSIQALASAMRRQRRPVVVDLFAGGGGASEGIKWALGVEPVLALNHDPAAIAMHRANHPPTVHIIDDVFAVAPARFRRLLIDLLWASPSCTHFSRARGGKPVKTQLRTLGWAVVQWAQQRAPRVICVENVAEMLGWGPLYEAGDLIVTGYRKTKTRTEAACIVAKVGTLTPRRGAVGLAAWARQARAAGLQVERVPVLRDPGGRSVRLATGVSPLTSPGPLGLAQRQRLVRHHGQPIPERKGETYRDWVHALELAGYRVEWRQLAACDYGAPTTRKRLFIVARRDRVPIRWPAPTHGPGLLPYRTAAEIIDWAQPCPSIFTRKKPLADATQRRIAEGIRRYVLSGDPFLVNLTHGGRLESLDRPAATITGANRDEKALVSAVLTRAHQHGWDRAGGPSQPLGAPTLTATDEHALVTVSLLQFSHGGRNEDARRPLGTTTAGPKGGDRMLLSGSLVKLYTKSTTASVDAPAPTVTGTDKLALADAKLAAVALDKMYGSARAGQRVTEPAPTITASGGRGGHHVGLVAAGLARYHGEKRRGEAPRVASPSEPVPTATTENRFATVAAFLARHNGTTTGHGNRGRSIGEPTGAITAVDTHAVVKVDLERCGLTPAQLASGRAVAAFLVKWYGQGGTSQSAREPLHTIPTLDRFGLVTITLTARSHPVAVRVWGRWRRVCFAWPQRWAIVDIGLRMLSPRELARAQGFGDNYQLTGTRSEQIGRIGNSVCPPVVDALVRSLFADELAGIGGRSMARRAQHHALR